MRTAVALGLAALIAQIGCGAPLDREPRTRTTSARENERRHVRGLVERGVALEREGRAAEAKRVLAAARAAAERLTGAHARPDVISDAVVVFAIGGYAVYRVALASGEAALLVAHVGDGSARPERLLADIDPGLTEVRGWVAAGGESIALAIGGRFFPSTDGAPVAVPKGAIALAPSRSKFAVVGTDTIEVRTAADGAMSLRARLAPSDRRGSARFIRDETAIVSVGPGAPFFWLDLRAQDVIEDPAAIASALSTSGRILAALFATPSEDARRPEIIARVWDTGRRGQRPNEIALGPLPTGELEALGPPVVWLDVDPTEHFLVYRSQQLAALREHPEPKLEALIDLRTGKRAPAPSAQVSLPASLPDKCRVTELAVRGKALVGSYATASIRQHGCDESDDKRLMAHAEGELDELGRARNIDIILASERGAILGRCPVPSPQPSTIDVSFGPGDVLQIEIDAESHRTFLLDPRTCTSFEGGPGCASGSSEDGRYGWSCGTLFDFRAERAVAGAGGAICRIGDFVGPASLCGVRPTSPSSAR